MNDLLPREKALQYGISTLNNNELLALIIKSSYPKSNVFKLVENLINKANGFYNLFSLSYEELISIKGIKQARALEILAILEIGKRLSQIDRVKENDLNNPEKVVKWLRFNLGYSDVEEFFVVYLNGKGTIIKAETLFKGSKNTSIVGIDEILRKAIILKASYILVAHNHPSDDATPSNQDIYLTDNLSKSCEMMGIPLLDHIIIGKTSYFSFKNHSMLK